MMVYELFRMQELHFQVMLCQYLCKYFRCNLAPSFITIYTNTTLNDFYGIKTYVPIIFRVGSTCSFRTLESHRPPLLVSNMANWEIYLIYPYLWDIRSPRWLIVEVCLETRITWNLSKLYRLRLYVWHVNCCYGKCNCLRNGLVELIVLVQAQHINNRKYSISYAINDVCRQTIVYRYCNVMQWRTQEFFFGWGGSTNSVEDREKGDLGVVTP